MDRGAVLVLEVSMNVFVLENLEIVMYVPLLGMTCLYQLKRRWRLDSLDLSFMSSLCRCCGRESLVLWQRVITGYVSPVCARVLVSVCVSGICLQLCYWLNQQLGKQQLCPSDWTESSDP